MTATRGGFEEEEEEEEEAEGEEERRGRGGGGGAVWVGVVGDSSSFEDDALATKEKALEFPRPCCLLSGCRLLAGPNGVRDPGRAWRESIVWADSNSALFVVVRALCLDRFFQFFFLDNGKIRSFPLFYMSRSSALILIQWLRALGGFVDERLAVTASGSR